MEKKTKGIDLPDLFAKTCAFCGKEFVPAPEHLYRIRNSWFCRWNCYCAAQRADSKEKREAFRNHPVEMLDGSGAVLREFDSAKAAAEEMGFRTEGIRKNCRGETVTYQGYSWRYKGEILP